VAKKLPVPTLSLASSAPGVHRVIPGLPAAMALRPYQVRWVQDDARFKIAVKSARIGFSFATALEAVLDCLRNSNTTWTVLSASKAQSVEFIETCHRLLELLAGTAELYQDEDWHDEFGSIEAIQQRITFSNGARIIALPANPRTARGYPGNAILDEFAHHEESYAIWAAVTRQVALGHKVRVLSTPNGEQGKFFDLCKELGLTDGFAPENNFDVHKGWSIHWIDASMAIADGCPINMQEMRDLIKDDDIVNQEFYCAFLKSGGAWIPLDLIQRAESDMATLEWPGGYAARGLLYGGIDVGRFSNRTTFWLKEKLGDVLITRMAIALHNMPFPELARTLAPWVKMSQVTALDSTGMGIGLFDLLTEACPGRVMGVNFAGSSRIRDEKKKKHPALSSVADGAVRLKVDIAMRLKQSLESSRERIPYSLDIRTELQAVKRTATASGVSFEAPQIAIDTGLAGGKKQKAFAHADHFWGCGLATYAAESNVIVLGIQSSAASPSFTYARGIL
jgi:phage FluMu gp28-like protein